MMLSTVLIDFGRFVLFKPLKGDPRTNWIAYLIVGFAITWIVGAGRYWDDANAPALIRSGVTSILYTLVLSAFIWAVVLALRPARWSYRNVLLMVTMTSLPGIIYAIPVERFMAVESASVANLVFLVIVAAWRMALYRHFLVRVAKLPPYETLVAWLLPPSVIVAALSVFGFLNAVLRGMSGDRAPDASEGATGLFLFIGLAAWIALPLLLASFIVMAFRRKKPTPGATDHDRSTS